MEIYEKITVDKYTAIIEFDDCPESPREWCNLGSMVCFHNRYNLGDKHNYTVDRLQELISRDDVVSLPLYLYDHGGTTISTSPFSCSWDSGQVGYIFADHETICREYGVEEVTEDIKKQVIDCLEAEVEAYDQYLRGDVFSYTITKEGYDELLDSCYGFFGEDHVIGEATSMLNHFVAEDRRQMELDGIQMELELFALA